MGQIDIWYDGNLSTRCVHRESGAEIKTDAPKDNEGLGQEFSPTDLVSAALGSCILTVMGIVARKLNVEIQGTKLTLVKGMQAAPSRRIGSLVAHVYCPYTFAPDVIEKLIRAAEMCPVRQSLHPEIHQELIFHWGSG